MSPIEMGLGAVEALAVPGEGRVVGVYPKAAYLDAPGGLLALTTMAVPPGPAHARVAADLAGLRAGDRVVVTPSWLQAGAVLVDRRAARRWRGKLPPAEAPLDLAVALLAGVPDPGLPVDHRLLRDCDWRSLAASLGGVGPGLTPAGDDCLAGILLAAHLRWGVDDDADAVAASAPTNDVARLFLRWAARGQSIEPVHRFLLASAAGDDATARDALTALLAVGHSSGAALAYGLRLGLAPDFCESAASCPVRRCG